MMKTIRLRADSPVSICSQKTLCFKVQTCGYRIQGRQDQLAGWNLWEENAHHIAQFFFALKRWITKRFQNFLPRYFVNRML
ncbi:MAG: hypothetical protein LAO78_10335 [Acidobacteriia bacterium]|nr:hypothetical protein [Terriglobia bacterium]